MTGSKQQSPQPVRVAATKCPMCGAATVARYRPFCSKRCSDRDLFNWLGEGYRMPTDEPAPPELMGGSGDSGLEE